jgi:dihydrofolate reductase
MTKVIFDISMSLDGFVTASGLRPDEPLGEGGQRLHEWATSESDARSREVLNDERNATGAMISGRRTYDTSLPWWGADGPSGTARLPLFVVSHDVPAQLPAEGVYTFVEDIHRALEGAKAAADDRNVSVMGGAEIGQQFIRAGLIDEILIHLVPVLFGSGTRMFDHIGDEHIHLQTIQVIEAPAATHLRFRVVKQPS